MLFIRNHIVYLYTYELNQNKLLHLVAGSPKVNHGNC